MPINFGTNPDPELEDPHKIPKEQTSFDKLEFEREQKEDKDLNEIPEKEINVTRDKPLLTKQRDAVYSFNYSDIVSGQSYVKFYCNYINPKTTVYESYTTNDDTDNTVSSGNWFAQTFTVGNTGTNENFWVNGCEIFSSEVGTATGVIVASIRAVDGNNKPTGIDLAYGSVATAISSTDHFHRITFSRPTLLLASTQYALVIREAGSDNFIWRSDNSTPTYTGGSVNTSTDSGASWDAVSTTKDFLFKILGDTRPPLTFSREALDAGTQLIEDIVSATSYALQFSTDIDLPFNNASNLRGMIVLKTNLTNVRGTNNEGSSYYFNFEAFRIRTGVANLSIGTSSSETKDFIADGSHTFYSQIFLENTQHFKAGDALRISMDLYAKVDDAGIGTDITVDLGNITMDIPFKIPD